jgi:RNA exonuclease 4
MANGVWISKKNKAKIRARRKKQKTSNHKHQGDDETQKNEQENQQIATAEGTVTKDNTHEKVITSNTNNDEKEKFNSLNNSLTSIPTLEITIPTSTSAKDAKKIRKDARRKARKDGIEESRILFINEHGEKIQNDSSSSSCSQDLKNTTKRNPPTLTEEEPPTKKIKKMKNPSAPSFPRINDILQQAKKTKQEQEAKQKQIEYENSIPEEIKSKYIALDCEMVGIGSKGQTSALARVSIVNWHGSVLLDTFVQVPDRVTDFRTFVSGVRPKDIQESNSKSMELHSCRKAVGELLKNKILVGHALKNDFQALMLDHPKDEVRDTARYKPFMRQLGKNGGKYRPRKLRDLVKEHLGLEIQVAGEAHCSIDDAKAAMDLYKLVREDWETEVLRASIKKASKKK